MGTLTGKSALLTGASRGIGAAVAITYSSSPERAQQVVKEITDSGGTGIATKADAVDQNAVRAAVQATAKEFGKIDILVNNAGVLSLGPSRTSRR